MTATTIEQIRAQLIAIFSPNELTIQDDSHLHKGHPGAADGGGHYTIRITGTAFNGKSLLERHRLIYAALANMMPECIHALRLDVQGYQEVT
jgi:BolA family transcriptional regulator, general stress-responsive regulator